MGIAPSEARRLGYRDYAALVAAWNARHDPEGEAAPVIPPDDDFVRARQAALAARGLAA
jgi:hypothetical protein